MSDVTFPTYHKAAIRLCSLQSHDSLSGRGSSVIAQDICEQPTYLQFQLESIYCFTFIFHRRSI